MLRDRLRRLAPWVAVLALLALVGAGPGVRLGLWDFRTGFTLLRWAAYLGLAAAGEAGLVLVQETRANRKVATVVAGFLDDDAAKLNSCIAGVTVLGSGRDAARLVASSKRGGHPISEIIIEERGTKELIQRMSDPYWFDYPQDWIDKYGDMDGDGAAAMLEMYHAVDEGRLRA